MKVQTEIIGLSVDLHLSSIVNLIEVWEDEKNWAEILREAKIAYILVLRKESSFHDLGGGEAWGVYINCILANQIIYKQFFIDIIK